MTSDQRLGLGALGITISTSSTDKLLRRLKEQCKLNELNQAKEALQNV